MLDVVCESLEMQGTPLHSAVNVHSMSNSVPYLTFHSVRFGQVE